jgi:hypothetical protein
VLDLIPLGAAAIEYAHDPDPADIESIVLPAVRSAAAAMRTRLSRQAA